MRRTVLLAGVMAGLAVPAPALAGPAEDLRGILESCQSDENAACAEALWGFIDVTGDESLSLAELSRLFRVLTEAYVPTIEALGESMDEPTSDLPPAKLPKSRQAAAPDEAGGQALPDEPLADEALPEGPVPEGPVVDESTVAAAILVVAAVGPAVANLVIANFDYDDDGRISKQEFYHDLGPDELVALVLEQMDKLPAHAGALMEKAMEAQEGLDLDVQ